MCPSCNDIHHILSHHYGNKVRQWCYTYINEAQQIADSTLTAVLGRESAYTGEELTWEALMSSGQSLVPPSLAFGPMPFPAVAVPGRTQLSRAPWAETSP